MPVPVKVRALFASARLTRRKAGQDMDGKIAELKEQEESNRIDFEL